ncbi:MAG: NADH-quinone oxidoreductase subunit J [Demequinaceae bacterium]|nr:NADH-quinone oxidoreductase subunit J [Demequinaceae bacterium]
MISPILFWFIAIITVLPALALLFARKAVHVAMAVILVMLGLAISYVALGAPFLGVVQIVVYTGAVMMLFLFVLMLVGVDQRESLKETIAGQRWIAITLAIGLGALLISVVSRVKFGVAANVVDGGPAEVAPLLYGNYVLVVETLGFLLITAAVGALVLTHVPRLFPRRTQSELQAERIAAGANPVNKTFPGVYARHNALDAPALDPQGEPIEESVSRVLKIRSQTNDGIEFRDENKARRRELGAKEGDA